MGSVSLRKKWHKRWKFTPATKHEQEKTGQTSLFEPSLSVYAMKLIFFRDASQTKIFIDFFWPQGYKKNFMLNSAEHEISNAHKYKSTKKGSFFQAQVSSENFMLT